MPDQVQAAKTLTPQSFAAYPPMYAFILGVAAHLLSTDLPAIFPPAYAESFVGICAGAFVYLLHRHSEQKKAATAVGLVAAADNQQLPGLPSAVEAAKK